MSDILLRGVPENLRQKLEERARAHHRSLSDEAEILLESALSATGEPRPGSQPGLGGLLAKLIPAEFRGEDFVGLRDCSERPPPFFE